MTNAAQQGEMRASDGDNSDVLKEQQPTPDPTPTLTPTDTKDTANAEDDANRGAAVQSELSVSKQRGERPTSVVPPFWQHTRHASRVSVASSLGAIGIRLEDNTEEGAAGDNDGGYLTAPKSPLWARTVDIDEHVRVEGDVKGVGGYTVWLIRVETLDSGGNISLRKRYSEFEALREQLTATFPRAGSSLPQLPPKSVIYKFRPSFLEKRRIGLKYFLTCVLLNPEFAGCPAVHDFIFG